MKRAAPMVVLLGGIGSLGTASLLEGIPMLVAMLVGLLAVVVGAALVHRQRRG